VEGIIPKPSTSIITHGVGMTYDVYAIGWGLIIVPREMVLAKAACRTVFLSYHVLAKGGFEPGYDASSTILDNKVMKQKISLKNSLTAIGSHDSQFLRRFFGDW
jgi:hypothetical protein